MNPSPTPDPAHRVETDPDFMTPAQLEARAAEANAENRVLYDALDKIADKEAALGVTLHNQGLTDANCAIAYRSVFHMTLNAELAWEAARRQQLLFLRGIQKSSQERYRNMRSDVYHYTVDHRRRLRSAGDRALEIARIAALQNPFAPGGAAYGSGS